MENVFEVLRNLTIFAFFFFGKKNTEKITNITKGGVSERYLGNSRYSLTKIKKGISGEITEKISFIIAKEFLKKKKNKK